MIGWLRSRVLTPRRPDAPGIEYPDESTLRPWIPELGAVQREQLAALVDGQGQFLEVATRNGRGLARQLRGECGLPPVVIAGQLLTLLAYASAVLDVYAWDDAAAFRLLTDAMGTAAIELTEAYREATAVRHERAGG